MSLAGGGTDLEPFILEYGGSVIATTIDLHVETTVQLISESGITIESVDQGLNLYLSEGVADENLLENILTACLTKIPSSFRTGLKIRVKSPVPARSGLGASSAIILSILGALYTLIKLEFSTQSLAIDAYEIERVLLKIPGGCQDQYVCATGGFNRFDFKNYKESRVSQVSIPDAFLAKLESSAFFVWTGISRNSNTVLSDQIDKNEKRQNIQALLSQKELVNSVQEILLRGDLKSLGEILSRSWELKRGVSDLVSSSEIDKVYEIGMQQGALGGKLLGAGGGGFFIFVCEPNQTARIISEIENFGYQVTLFKTTNMGLQVETS
jgi:D-glycero-alpha-D-manno-heptose-7-phosphate kinase